MRNSIIDYEFDIQDWHQLQVTFNWEFIRSNMNYNDKSDYEKEDDIHDIQVTYYIYTTNTKYEYINQYLNSIINKLFHFVSNK